MSSAICLSWILACAPQDPTALRSAIVEVTVFPGRALVRRHAEVDVGAGRFLLSGLPGSLNLDSIRVRCDGAVVVGTHSFPRFQPRVPEARIEELRSAQRSLQGEIVGLEDESSSIGAVEAHLERSLETAPGKAGDKQAPVALESWAKNLEFVTGELSRMRAARRELSRRIDELKVRLADVEAQLGACSPTDGVQLRDVYVDLAGGSGVVRLDIEYVVDGAGWEPLYDLRAAPDGRKVELGYRANVWQSTGEDWSDVEMSLSTATPRLGAQGPDPEPIWLRFQEQRRVWAGEVVERKSVDKLALRSNVAFEDESDADDFSAVAENQGLSMRFRLARRESVPSKPEPSSVLVGQATFDATPEYFCAPELDTNVWLRGRTVNSSAWTLLPGNAAVYFGADYLGTARIAAVQPGAEFTLHLGPDPALTVERTTLEDVLTEPGLFSSQTTHAETFRIRIENHGAAVARADGSALVFVRETLPKSRDERIEIEITSPGNRLLEDARWKQAREEQGTLTWLVTAPKNGEGLLQYTRKIRYPEKGTIVRQ
jgi:uncharacterized protein (TIGR02231 family)